ncbi:MAG: hypothetical protein WCH59_04380 [Chitinophagia bacterium]
MENPWKKINTSCRVCEIDKDYFVKNKHLEISQIEIPEPFIGCPEAPIYILMGSPLVSIKDLNQKDLTQKIEDEKTEEHPSLARSNSLANITNPFEYKDYPFYSISPELKNSKSIKDQKHYKWWWRVFESLSKEIQNKLNDKSEKTNKYIIKGISHTFFNLELYGYHSNKTIHSVLSKRNRLPSVNYSIELVIQAMANKKLIIIPRAVNTWFKIIPDLDNYEKCYFAATNREIEIKKNTISPKAYQEMVDLIIEKVKKIKV